MHLGTGELVRLDADSLAEALGSEKIRFHEGSLRGAFPRGFAEAARGRIKAGKRLGRAKPGELFLSHLMTRTDPPHMQSPLRSTVGRG